MRLHRDRSSSMLARWIVAIASFAAAIANAPATQAEATPKAGPLDGVWVAKSAMALGGKRGMLGWVWTSRFVIGGHRFDISHFYDASADLHMHGAVSFPAGEDPRAIDLDVDELDMSAIGEPVKYLHCLLRGIYQLNGDELTVCFHESQTAPRPNEFRPPKDGVLLRLVRVRPDFKEFPREITVRALGPQGRPAAGVSVFNYMSFFVRGEPKPNDPPPTWRYRELAKTGPDGTARVPYRKLSSGMARDSAGQLIGFAEVSPASALAGSVTVQLQPRSTLRGTITCDALSRAKKPIGWTNVLLYLENGQQIGECSSRKGEFEFSVPTGRYQLSAYGTNIDGRLLNIEVPAATSVVQAPPIAAEASNLVLLEGNPAPELRDVMGWKGTPVRLADERGRLVLLNFWGYWCGPCVHEMPTLIEIYERYHGKGLDIIGVHVDMAGEVDSAAKLDQKTASFKTSLWHGKDLPFPIALISGEQRRAGERARGSLADYGIDSYPTTILIDREGKVVGWFDASNRDKAFAEIKNRLEDRRDDDR